MNTIKCSCGCNTNSCKFNPCAVTCSPCVEAPRGYGYVYNITRQNVDEDEAVTFSSNGLLSSGITHVAGTSDIVITTAGVYLINYYVGEEGQFTVYQNSAPVAGSTYASSEDIIYGQVIISAQAGDIITLVNTDNDDVDLDADGKAPENVTNASMTILRVF
ncbi:MAG: hypothetical protein J1E41_05155 [Ruminococcus sp.]|nr:hypothetical protein [Ruminococcus sp.]